MGRRSLPLDMILVAVELARSCRRNGEEYLERDALSYQVFITIERTSGGGPTNSTRSLASGCL